MSMHKFPNEQKFDLPGLKGRLMSSSYCPAADEAGFSELMSELEALYSKHATNDGVIFTYSTQLYMS